MLSGFNSPSAICPCRCIPDLFSTRYATSWRLCAHLPESVASTCLAAGSGAGGVRRAGAVVQRDAVPQELGLTSRERIAKRGRHSPQRRRERRGSAEKTKDRSTERGLRTIGGEGSAEEAESAEVASANSGLRTWAPGALAAVVYGWHISTVKLFASFCLPLWPCTGLCADAARIGLQGTWNIRLDPSGAGTRNAGLRPLRGDTMFLPGARTRAGTGSRPSRRIRAGSRPLQIRRARLVPEEVTVPRRGAAPRYAVSGNAPTGNGAVGGRARARHAQQPVHAARVRCLGGAGPVRTASRYAWTTATRSTWDTTRTRWASTRRPTGTAIVGAMELRAGAPAWIDDLAIYADVAARGCA